MSFLQKVTNHPAWYVFWLAYTGVFTIRYAINGQSGYAAFMGVLFGLWVGWTITVITDRMIERRIIKAIEEITDQYNMKEVYK